jgi:hypothetical protein
MRKEAADLNGPARGHRGGDALPYTSQQITLVTATVTDKNNPDAILKACGALGGM